MRNWIQWQDHVTEYEDRYKETQNDDGSVTHTPVQGSVIQQGTPQNAKNFNSMEDGITNGTETAAFAMLAIMHARQTEADLAGEVINADLTNTQDYPFNNSEKTIPLTTKRNHVNYTVECEVASKNDGFTGDIVVSEKLLNGFKIAYTGSAKNVSLKIYVKGGFY